MDRDGGPLQLVNCSTEVHGTVAETLEKAKGQELLVCFVYDF